MARASALAILVHDVQVEPHEVLSTLNRLFGDGASTGQHVVLLVDGAVGAAFLKTLKGLLEDPVRILI